MRPLEQSYLSLADLLPRQGPGQSSSVGETTGDDPVVVLGTVELQGDGGLPGSPPHQVLQSLKSLESLDISTCINKSLVHQCTR